MVYPLYCLLLTISATGIPSSIAALTAERLGKGESDKGVLKSALKLFALIGIFGALSMCLLAPMLARAQGKPNLISGYFALAPSVFLVSILSVFRGWFQGRNYMSPTACSEVIEQVVKVSVGLVFAYLYRANLQKAVTYLLFSVSISELFALIFMWIKYRNYGKNSAPFQGLKECEKITFRRILKMSIPVTFNAALIPLSGMLDSVLIVRILARYTSDAVSLYGLFSGGAVTVINLPVSICYGIAAASIPAVATAKNNGASPRKRVLFSLFITLLVSIPSALLLYFFAEPAVSLIYRSLAGSEKQTLAQLVKLFSISAVTLSCAQTLSACLTAQGKPKYAAISMLIGVTAKTVLNVFLVRNPEWNIYGAAIAANVCYLLAFALDFVYNLYITRKKRAGKSGERSENYDYGSGARRKEGRFDGKRQTGD
jgi:stage V sporulation protein B